MSDPKYAYPYPAQGYYQGPPVMPPPQYYAPPPRRQAGFLEGCDSSTSIVGEDDELPTIGGSSQCITNSPLPKLQALQLFVVAASSMSVAAIHRSYL